MTVIVMDCAPESVRGELTRWFLELKPGVFIGKVNVKIRELLWERICQDERARGAVMVYDSNNEQGFEMKIYGDPKRRVIDNEFHSFVLADLRRLAAKKALASSRNSFSSLRRLISLFCSFTCLRSS